MFCSKDHPVTGHLSVLLGQVIPDLNFFLTLPALAPRGGGEILIFTHFAYPVHWFLFL